MQTFQLIDSNTNKTWEFDIDVSYEEFDDFICYDDEWVCGPLDEAEAGDPYVPGTTAGALDATEGPPSVYDSVAYCSYERPVEDFPILIEHFRTFFINRGWNCSPTRTY